jgi:hypothetical protein
MHIDLSSTGLTGWMDVLPLLVLCVPCMNRTPTVGGGHICIAGIVPRVFWISIGGAVFLGAYEQAKSTLIDVV